MLVLFCSCYGKMTNFAFAIVWLIQWYWYVCDKASKKHGHHNTNTKFLYFILMTELGLPSAKIVNVEQVAV